MSATLAIARKELRQLFLAPLGWGVLAASTALLAWLFLVGIDGFQALSPSLEQSSGTAGVTDLVIAPFLSTVALWLMLVAPLVAMRSVCGERRGHTLALLFAGGAGGGALALGKFLGVAGFLLVLLALLATMPLSLAAGTSLDYGKLAAGLAGLALLAIALAAIGVMASSYAQHPASAALGALGAGAFLWLVDGAARAQGVTQGLINYVALPTHLTAFMRGIVASVDVAYFLLLTVLCLALAARRIARLRQDA